MSNAKLTEDALEQGWMESFRLRSRILDMQRGSVLAACTPDRVVLTSQLIAETSAK